MERAIGTRVSEAVYKNVVEDGRLWWTGLCSHRLVPDSLEPIRNIKARSSASFMSVPWRAFYGYAEEYIPGFYGHTLLASGLAAIISIVLAGAISDR